MIFIKQIQRRPKTLRFRADRITSQLKFGCVSTWRISVVILKCPSRFSVIWIVSFISSAFFQNGTASCSLVRLKVRVMFAAFKSLCYGFIDSGQIRLIILNNSIYLLCIFTKGIYLVLINNCFMVIRYFVQLLTHRTEFSFLTIFTTRTFISL